MSGLTYGIYAAGRVAGTAGPPDDRAAIDDLVGGLSGGRPFVVREYLHFLGTPADPEKARALAPERRLRELTMPDEWYTTGDRRLDLVLCYLPDQRDLDGWLAFVERAVHRYGAVARFLQITLEPNFPLPWIDGSSPGVLDALTAGTRHARRLLDAAGHRDVRIGFSVAEPPEFLGGDDAFWAHLEALAPADFAAHVDYVGLGLYPDAFSPVPEPALAGLTEHALRHLREHRMPRAHLGPEVPLHVAENGTPTGPGRTPADQAARLDIMIRTVAACAARLNVTHYELFGLRDADSGRDEPTARLGLTTSDYRPKPAYDVYRRLIAQS
ncbi:hypothetical protein HCN51_33770 [Nonomuraea sp. FMUSA5-5]|uniref:Arabinogalactan endo-beta-1,4-galactanase n=1 Tax=Nonomuraea composti TaxID=2720023 RepID=A0ABX1BC04_9ACTN|nr:hypothetical protein [Nonomuraea sp. FMUSA5-5]NJP94352.1 hypothetical protein [Nonomuraea sp. FMUSA5-5]